MTLVRTNHNGTQRSFNSFVDEFFNELPVTWGRESNQNFPAVNIHETSDSYHLELNAPGRNKEDFKVTLEKGLLTISFEKKEEAKTEEYKTVRKEFSYKSFKRSFSVDDKIDAEGIQAKYENGVLKLLLPKKAQAAENTKQINVQ